MDKMQPVVAVKNMHDPSLAKADLDYWLSRPPEERVAAVDLLRAQFYGPGPRRLEKVIRVVRRKDLEAEEALGERAQRDVGEGSQPL